MPISAAAIEQKRGLVVKRQLLRRIDCQGAKPESTKPTAGGSESEGM